MSQSTYVYVSYIRTTPQALWDALTDPAMIRQFWFGMQCDSQFSTGASWQLSAASGEVYDNGRILAADPPRRLQIEWQHQRLPELKAEGPSVCTMELEPSGSAVKLTVTHSIGCERSQLITAVSGGWPKVLSNLKSLLETGQIAVDEGCGAAKTAA